MKKTIYKYFGKRENLNETKQLGLTREGAFMLLKDVGSNQINSVEIPMFLDLRE